MGTLAQGRPVVDIPLSLFSGMDPELAPADVPEGLSPDNQDVIFFPGSVDSREALHKLLTAGLINNPTVTYQKSFLAPDGTLYNLILDSGGTLWLYNGSGGVFSPFPVAADMWGQSVTAFGREYIAISDLLHGEDIPRQFDGTNLDRVTQDGPGVAPIVTEDLSTVASLAASPDGVVSIGAKTIVAISQVGTLVTASFSGWAYNFLPRLGDAVLIAGVGIGGYNGTWSIVSAQFALLNQITITFNVTTPGLASTSGGTGSFPYYSVNATSALPFIAGDTVYLAGVTEPAYDGAHPVVNAPGGDTVFIYFGTINLAASGGGTIGYGGSISIGMHQVVYSFLTRNGYLTKPSPAATWFASGGRRVSLTSIAIGPPNVIARVFSFTGSGGDNFFAILANVTLPDPAAGINIVTDATIVFDNTSTTAIFDFSDNALFAANAIDIPGNNLFDQAVLGPCAGFFAYDSRLFAWGEYNTVQNFRSLGFCGGSIAGLARPAGWDFSANAGGTLVTGGPWQEGQSWKITGDGTANPRGQISQSAYLDDAGAPILEENVAYGARMWAVRSAAATGNLFLSVFSQALGSGTTFFWDISTLPTGKGFFIPFQYMPVGFVPVPNDLKITLWATNLPNGESVTLSELQFIPKEEPYLNNEMKASYVNNPEAFALTTGGIGPADDPSPIQCLSLQRNTVLLKTLDGTHQFQSSDFEPYQWQVNQLSRSVGAISMRAGDPGKFGTGDAAEDWDLTFTRNGLYLFAGGDFWKTSQEMQPYIDQINWAAESTIFVKNDISKRRAYIGIPTGTATAPNLILVMDYRELDTATQIASSPPVHISLTGKMVCSDLTRKWTRWNVVANTAEVLELPGNVVMMTFGGGNGQAPGVESGFGNLYYLDPLKYTDDDYGQISPYYTTYFFINHEQEQALGIGSHRKLMKKVCMYVTGIGNIGFTPLIDSLYNPQPASSLRRLIANTSQATALTQDLEWTTGIRGERIALKIAPTPLPGTTDVQMSLQKLIVTMCADPIQATRTSRL